MSFVLEITKGPGPQVDWGKVSVIPSERHLFGTLFGDVAKLQRGTDQALWRLMPDKHPMAGGRSDLVEVNKAVEVATPRSNGRIVILP